MLKPAFVDLSHWNTIPQSLHAAADSGIVGVVHKATEGDSVVDDKLDARYLLTRDAGLRWGVYHFIRPGNVADQVAHFLDAISPYVDDATLFALDWEDRGVSTEDAIEFLERVEAITGSSPVLYTGYVCKEQLLEPDPRINRFRLWLAQYGDEAELPPGWSKYWAWQYSDKGNVPGIDPPVDVNAYDGTVEQLNDEWAGSGATPEPEPEDEVEVVVIAPPGVKVTVRSTEEVS